MSGRVTDWRLISLIHDDGETLRRAINSALSGAAVIQSFDGNGCSSSAALARVEREYAIGTEFRLHLEKVGISISDDCEGDVLTRFVRSGADVPNEFRIGLDSRVLSYVECCVR